MKTLSLGAMRQITGGCAFCGIFRWKITR